MKKLLLLSLLVANFAFAQKDADIPPKFEDKIDEEVYQRLRSEYLDLLRGLPANPSLRATAIDKMQKQMQTMKARGVAGPATLNAPANSVPAGPTWTPLGPSPIPNGQVTNSLAVTGRVTAFAIDPTNSNVVYLGTAQGGVYRSTDAGAHWTQIFDQATTSAIGALAIAPSNHTILFVGTGEANGSADSYAGVGLYRIDNADTTATLVGPISPIRNYTDGNSNPQSVPAFQGRSISSIVVHPTDPSILWVGAVGGVIGIGGDAPFGGTVPPEGMRGLYRLTNATSAPASVTVQKVAVTAAAPGFDLPNTGNRNVDSIVMEPGNPDNLTVWINGTTSAGDGGIYHSTNATSAVPTFTQVFTTTTSSARGIFTIYKQGVNPAVLYVADGESSTGRLRVSTDGGVTWSAALAGGRGFCGGQCFYNIGIDVLPGPTTATSDDIIVLGGNTPSTNASTRLFAKSTNGGATFTETSDGLHADTHFIRIDPNNSSIIYHGDDGGIFKSIDAGLTWSSLNTAQINSVQFSGLAVHPIDPKWSIGGTQDNGTNMRDASGNWNRVDFGDGGYALIDRNATDTSNITLYHTYFNQTNNLIGFARVLSAGCASDGNWAFKGIYGGAVDPTVYCDGSDTFNGIALTDAVLFYAPMELGPGNPSTVYFGAGAVYRSTDKGETMPAVSQRTTSAVSTIAVSPQDDNYRMFGRVDGTIDYTTTGANPMTALTGIPARYVARIKFDPSDKNTAYVTLGGYFGGTSTAQSHVWKVTNLNTSPAVTGINNGLPDVPVNSFAVDPVNGANLFAGTDIGVYGSTDGGATWQPYGTGLPVVAVFGMEIQAPSRTLRIGTHGRGMWDISLPSIVPALTSVTPNSGLQGQTIASVALVGQFTHFVQGTSTATFGAGITVNSLTVSDTTHATANITIDPAGAIGNRNVTVTTGGEVVTLTNGFSVTNGTPALTSVTPNTGQQGQTIASVALVGQFTHFVQGTSTASFGAGITVNSLTVTDTTHATANITIDPAATTGNRNVTVTTGGEVVTLTNGFAVGAGTPVLSSVTPSSGVQGQTLASVALVGQFTHFLQGTSTANFGAGITVNSLTVTDTTHATASITIDPAASIGNRNVTVTTGGETATLANGFTVTAGTPVLTSVSPNSGQQRTANGPVVISGNFTHFSAASVVTFSGAGVTAGAPTAFTATSVTVPIAISGAAALGQRNIQVVTGGETVSQPNAFTVTAAVPVSIAVTPANPSVGQGLTQQFTATGTYQDASTQDLTAVVTWQSGNTSVATISPSSGLATVVASSGTTLISATLGATTGSTILTATAPPANAFLTSFTQSATQRSDYTGYVGMQLTVGPQPLNVYSLGRVCVAGNSQTHIVKLVSASTQTDVPGASTNVSMASCTPNQFVYSSLASPITLSAGSTYYLVSQKTGGGDKWYEQAPITTKTDATVNSSVYLNGAIWTTLGAPNTSYVPPDMQYAVVVPPPSPAFVQNYNLNNQGLRNDFTGYVGMSLKVGATPLNVTSLGRVCVAGNTQTHIVKFVDATTGQDVPGGSATVNMSGCTPSQFAYATLASPLTLQSNMQYYLVSQETNGGDKWYDQATLSTKADATVLSSVYTNGATYIPNALNTSYVPPNFQYSLVSNPGAVNVTVGASIAGPSFMVDGTTYTTQQTFTWISGSAHTIATTTPQAAGTGSRYAFTSWSDSGPISHSVSPVANANYVANFRRQYLLTTNVTGNGAIVANPTSPDGYYDSGASVQLTAAANPGSVFFNWTGDLSDGANPQSLTMSAPHSVTANFQGTTAAGGFLTSFGNASIRKDFSGFVGLSLTVSASPLSVTQVGRACLAGNASSHTVKFVDALTGVDVPGASASVNMAGCTAGQFQYATLTSPITLNAGAAYYLVSQETAGGDTWYDAGAVTSKADAQIKGSVYSNAGGYVMTPSPNTSYVPPDFKYTVQSPTGPQPLVTAFNLNNRPTRNDFAGFVGMKFTVGASNISVSSFGRLCLAGNSGTHTIELVNATTSAVVATVTLNFSGCTANSFVYGNPPSALTLPAGSSYYLASQETVNGDMWYDHGALTTTTAAQSINSVYFYNGGWQNIDGPNTSYVPVNLQYQIAP